MKKLSILMILMLLVIPTACSKKATTKEDTNKDSQQVTGENTETKKEEVDYSKVTNSMKLEKASETTTNFKATFENGSDKDFSISTIEVSVKKGEQVLASAKKKIDMTIKPGEKQEIVVELKGKFDDLDQEGNTLNWGTVNE